MAWIENKEYGFAINQDHSGLWLLEHHEYGQVGIFPHPDMAEDTMNKIIKIIRYERAKAIMRTRRK